MASLAIGWNKRVSHRFVDRYIACSSLAARFAFAKKDAEKARVIATGIDTEALAFSAKKREEFRTKFGYGPKTVVYGSAGRFDPQKNQFFLLDVYKEIGLRDPEARFFLSGRGPLEGAIREKCRQVGLEGRCQIVTEFLDYQSFYSGLDAFLLPSAFEGLGLVLVEAQCSGLPCFATAGTIPQEAKILSSFQFLPLEEGPAGWASSILQSSQPSDREDAHLKLKEEGWDLEETARKYAELFQ